MDDLTRSHAPPRRRRIACAVFALGMACTGAAHAWTLDALLRLPIERLLELRIGVARSAVDEGRARHAA